MGFLLCVLLVTAQDVAETDHQDDHFFWIELTEMRIDMTGDFGISGEVTPLIGVEPGRWDCPLSGVQDSVKMRNGVSMRFGGDSLYLPRHIMRPGRIAFGFCIVERDETSPDDVLLPPRLVEITLKDAAFKDDRAVLVRTFHCLTEINTPPGYAINEIEVTFRLMRRVARQLDVPKDAKDVDAFLRQRSEIRSLRRMLFHLFDAQIIGGMEVRLLTFEGSANDADAAASLARLLAEANLHEVRLMRHRVREHAGHPDFLALSQAYGDLLDRLEATPIAISVVHQKEPLTLPSIPEGADLRLP